MDLPTHEQIYKLQSALSVFPQIELETSHYFADGMYCRVIPRPAGTVLVGKVHKKEHFYIVCSGTIRVTTDEWMRDVIGPEVIVSKTGTKRAVLALTDAVCLTVHRTENTDLDEMEKELLEPDDTALFDAHNKLKFDVPRFRELTKRLIEGETCIDEWKYIIGTALEKGVNPFVTISDMTLPEHLLEDIK